MSPPAAPPASASKPKALDPAAVERFARDVTALLDPPRHGEVAARSADGGGLPLDATFRARPPRPEGKPLPQPARQTIALAVSGGADSMAMLLLAAAAFPGDVIAATVDHGLRPQAADEARLVATLCATLGVPHVTLAPLAPITGSSLQKQARVARYAALAAWLADIGHPPLMTAHHADDQAETLLMRLNRASGTTGLSGIRAVRREGDLLVLRPLLAWRRRELRDVAEAAGIAWVEDPSNADPRHDRTRYRAFLDGQDLLSPAALAAAAAHIAQTDAALADLTDRLWDARWAPGTARLDATDLPREVRRRLARRAVLELRARHAIATPHFAAASNVEPLLDSLEAGRAATQAGVLVTPRGAHWHFAIAPARRSH